MRKIIVDIWNKVSELGLSPDRPEENHLVQWYSRMSLISLICTFPMIIASFWIEIVLAYKIVLVVILFSFLSVLFLNYKHKIYAARYTVSVISPLWGNGLHLAIGGYFGQGIITIASLAMVFVAFQKRPTERWWLTIFHVTIFIGTSVYVAFFDPLYGVQDVPLDELMVFIAASGWLFVVLLAFGETKSRLVDDLKVKNKELENTSVELERFTHIASHDLKSPLRTIISFIGLAERNIKKGNLDGVADNLGYVKTGAQQMNFLVQDILEMAKININDGLPHELVDLNKVYHKAYQNLTEEITSGNAHINCAQLPQIMGIEVDFLMLFQNIIQNAIKYNDNISPEVFISAYEKAGDRLIITFRDNGIGIDKEFFDQIFHFFKRLHTSEKYQGTGLGLGLCKKIINRYQGDIKVDSIKGLGSTFSLEFPYGETMAILMEKEAQKKNAELVVEVA